MFFWMGGCGVSITGGGYCPTRPKDHELPLDTNPTVIFTVRLTCSY